MTEPEQDCLHEDVRFDWQLNQVEMMLELFAIVCKTCGAKTIPLEDAIVLGPWEKS